MYEEGGFSEREKKVTRIQEMHTSIWGKPLQGHDTNGLVRLAEKKSDHLSGGGKTER